jgi:hypothetical protein
MTDLVFMDIETLGLDPLAPIWEFAAIRRYSDKKYGEKTFRFFIDHDPGPWLKNLPLQFRKDYEARYDPELAITAWDASLEIAKATNHAYVVGAVPSFDTIRVELLLNRVGCEAKWHYHLIDVENLAAGMLAGRGLLREEPPWKSDELSMAIGVDPEKFARHTALGDVLWVKAQYDAIMNGE